MPRAKAASSPVVGRIVDSSRDIHTRIVKGRKPSMRFPLRSLSNVRYTPRKGYFEMAGKTKERTLSVSTVKTFAQTLRMIALSKQLIETNDFATKRDAYYQTKNWDDARCDEQVESDTIMDDVEATCRRCEAAGGTIVAPKASSRRSRADRAWCTLSRAATPAVFASAPPSSEIPTGTRRRSRRRRGSVRGWMHSTFDQRLRSRYCRWGQSR